MEEKVNLNQYLIDKYNTDKLDILLQKNIIRYEVNEFNNHRKKFWIGNHYLFKQQKKSSLESFTEVFIYELSKVLNISCAKYLLVTYNNNSGVLTESFLNKNEKLILGVDIINYLYFNNKTPNFNQLIELFKDNNNIHTVFKMILTYLEKQEIMYTKHQKKKLKKELLDMFFIDILTLQKDRHPFNWGIIIKNNKFISLAPLFDNSNAFNFNDIEWINNIQNIGFSESLFNQVLDTNLLLKFKNNNNNKFKELLAELKKSDPQSSQIYKNKVKNIVINNILSNIEQKMNNKNEFLKFKNIINEYYIKYLTILQEEL